MYKSDITKSISWDDVKNNLKDCSPITIIYNYVDHPEFTEEFILNNIDHFQEILSFLIRMKKTLSDEFFMKVCTKSNYSNFKTTRRLHEPYRDFSKLDALFY
jgi:hypothetical protein